MCFHLKIQIESKYYEKLKLADILATVLISFIFGLFYKVVGLMVAGLKPIGLHLDQLRMDYGSLPQLLRS